MGLKLTPKKDNNPPFVTNAEIDRIRGALGLKPGEYNTLLNDVVEVLEEILRERNKT